MTSSSTTTSPLGVMANSQKKTRRKKALGRGLGALIPNKPAGSKREYFECELDKIEPSPTQPRKHFDADALADLSASIKESGLIQPLVVRRVSEEETAEDQERYELIAGERRWRASRMAGLEAVPVVVKDVDDALAFALALIENIQRQDLNPVEEAMAYQRLINEFEFTQAELAEQVGKSRSAISNSIRLLNLPGDVQESLASSQLTPGHARTLLTLSEDDATGLAAMIMDEELTVRRSEDYARMLREGYSLDQLREGAYEERQQEGAAEEEIEEPVDDPVEGEDERAASSTADWRDDDTTRAIVTHLNDRLGAKVHLKDRHGKGRIEIYYDDYETLQQILRHFELEEGLDL